MIYKLYRSLFTPQEFECVLCGAPEFDIGLLKSVTKYEGAMNPNVTQVYVFTLLYQSIIIY